MTSGWVNEVLYGSTGGGDLGYIIAFGAVVMWLWWRARRR